MAKKGAPMGNHNAQGHGALLVRIFNRLDNIMVMALFALGLA